ncbi:hypothetical protein M885DRAFT_468330 [Pelagophyceae sp. CCMP2097]|nr:hypothetical protein M885DRAFT_468330 [Pelagophyceae sp. CCMP2097]
MSLRVAAALCLALAQALSPPRVHFSPLFEAHAVPAAHPERCDRASVALVAVEQLEGVRLVETLKLRPDLQEHLERVHDAEYLADLARPVGPKELRSFDADTWMGAASWNVTRLATTAWLNAVDCALEDASTVDFALTRPPGHHARKDQAMGFCTLNHAAVSTAYALTKVDRVAILDIDVHLGNGVASIFGGFEPQHRGRVRYASLHQHPCFPGSGGDSTMFGPLDTILFVPLPAGTAGSEWLAVLEGDVLPWLSDLKPQLLVVSAGFDALATDALAQLELSPADFFAAGRAIRKTFPDLPVVAGLEGGYDMQAMPLALSEFVRGCGVREE